MPVSIDELQVETQAPAPQAGGAAAGAGKEHSKPDIKTEIKAEMDRLHERELRLRAD
jgi:hypothetical protein